LPGNFLARGSFVQDCEDTFISIRVSLMCHPPLPPVCRRTSKFWTNLDSRRQYITRPKRLGRSECQE
jgi:hypothetical protein